MVEEDRNVWGKAYGLNQRGRHSSFTSALDAAFKDLLVERNDFFDSLVIQWKTLFPNVPAWPGRYEDGKVYLYVRTAPTRFVVQPRLRQIAAALQALPGAPKKVDLRVEIHAS